MLHKIVITGPESTGKTTLCHALAEYFKVKWVEEYARQYIDQLNRPYEMQDLIEIAKGQLFLEKKLEKEIADKDIFLFCDTDLITIKIWMEYKYGLSSIWLANQIREQAYHCYLLCDTNIPWEYDPQRENPNDRVALFELYKRELELWNKNYFIINGGRAERLEQAVEAVKTLV